MSQAIYLCQQCKKPSTASWHHADVTNSSAFCDVCGSFCNKHVFSCHDDIDFFIKRNNELHNEWLKKKGYEVHNER